MSANGSIQFRDIASFTLIPFVYGASSSSSAGVPVFSVTSVRVTRSKGNVYGTDNNRKRPIAFENVTESITVEVDSDDMNASQVVQGISSNTVFNIQFTGKIIANQLTTTPTPADKVVLIQNACLDNISDTDPSHTKHSFRMSFTILDMPNGTSDPISYT
jgi:hypothetical protein